jgi:hypothetical protein
MKKAVGYIRYGDGSEAEQKRTVQLYCDNEGYEVVDWVGEEVSDFGDVVYGSWKGHRKIDAVVAASNLDITGNVFEFYAYRCRLQMRGSMLIVAEWKEYAGYMAYRSVLERFSETLCRMELEHERIRNADGRKRKEIRGEYIGGNAPMGYRVSGGQLLVNESEVPVVKFIMEEKHAGRTMMGTMEKLNANGYRNRKGGLFTIGTVQGIWNNERFYHGYYRIKGTDEWVQGKHEAILND